MHRRALANISPGRFKAHPGTISVSWATFGTNALGSISLLRWLSGGVVPAPLGRQRGQPTRKREEVGAVWRGGMRERSFTPGRVLLGAAKWFRPRFRGLGQSLVQIKTAATLIVRLPAKLPTDVMRCTLFQRTSSWNQREIHSVKCERILENAGKCNARVDMNINIIGQQLQLYTG